jgi:uncharacterized protein (DUF952 family)
MLYKILPSLPREALKDGRVPGNAVLPLIPMDLKDGYIHLSSADQVANTLNQFFRDAKQVYILHIDIPDRPGASIPDGRPGNKYRSKLRWEWVESRRAYFPHIYGDLVNEDVRDVQILRRRNGIWQFP